MCRQRLSICNETPICKRPVITYIYLLFAKDLLFIFTHYLQKIYCTPVKSGRQIPIKRLPKLIIAAKTNTSDYLTLASKRIRTVMPVAFSLCPVAYGLWPVQAFSLWPAAYSRWLWPAAYIRCVACDLRPIADGR